MSRKPENQFIASVEAHLPPNGPGCYRMKNSNDFEGGIADKWYSGRRDLWIEYKYVVLPKRDDTPIHLVDGKDPEITSLQQKWLRERYCEGRNVWVIVGCKMGGVVLQDREWECREGPVTTSAFKACIKTRKDLASEILAFIT